MAATLLLRPELEHQQNRITIRLSLDAPLRGVKTERWLNYAHAETVRAANKAIRDIEKQGWRYVDTPLKMRGPLSPFAEARGIPKKPNIPRRRPGQPSIPLHKIDHTDWDYYTGNILPIAQHERWDYEFDLVFTRRMVVEVPDIAGKPSEMTLPEYLKESA
jgi:hypothetical protein